MSEYFSYYAGIGRDPTAKYVIEADRVIRYSKDSAFFAFLRPWRHSYEFRLTPDTKVLNVELYDGGNGGITCDFSSDRSAITGEYVIFIHERARDFASELERRLAAIRRG